MSLKFLIKTSSAILTASSLWMMTSMLEDNKAFAWFQVCNQSSSKAHVVFAYLNTLDNRSRPVPVPLGSAWVSEGWWSLNPGQCAQVYPHELWRRNSYYYVYAESDGRKKIWGGKHNFCLVRGVSFTTMQADLPINRPSPNNIINGCAAMDDKRKQGIPESQIQRVGFEQVEIQGRTQNFTYRLTN